MKIFAVSSGVYSDYHINAVFSTRELAQAYIAKRGDGLWDPNIEEWKVDEEADFIARPLYWAAVYLKTGDLVPEHCRTSTQWASPSARAYDEPRLVYTNRIVAGSFVSQEHALKLAAEKRQEILRSLRVSS